MPTVPTIRLSDDAPAEAVHFTFFADEFDLEGSGTYETSDEIVLGNAEGHPWLVVERPEVEQVSGDFFDQLSPKDDHLSSVGGINANDPEEIRKAEEGKLIAAGQPVAIEAGLDQKEPVVTSGIAETVAAIDETPPARSTKTSLTTDTTKDS